MKTLTIAAMVTAPITVPILLNSPYAAQGRIIFCGWGCGSGDIHTSGLAHLWDGLTKRYTTELDASWEQSLYVGPFVVVFLGLLRIRRVAPLDCVMAAVAVLSVGPVAGLLFNWTGLVAIDRLPTRLSIYPFTWFLYRSLR